MEVHPHLVHVEGRVEVLEVGERLLELVLRQVVGDGDVRVVGEGALQDQPSLAHARLQLLALADPLDHADEDDR